MTKMKLRMKVTKGTSCSTSHSIESARNASQSAVSRLSKERSLPVKKRKRISCPLEVQFCRKTNLGRRQEKVKKLLLWCNSQVISEIEPPKVYFNSISNFWRPDQASRAAAQGQEKLVCVFNWWKRQDNKSNSSRPVFWWHLKVWWDHCAHQGPMDCPMETWWLAGRQSLRIKHAQMTSCCLWMI